MTATDSKPGPTNATWREIMAEGRTPRLVLIWLAVWLFAADSLVTATIMPSVGHALGGVEFFSWATAGYLLASVFAGSSAGLLAKRFGLRQATAWSAALYAVGCAIGALAPNMTVFLIGRLLQGLGGGWVSGFASVAIGLLFANRMLPRVYAATAAIWGIATLLGPLVGGVFADAGAWRFVFWFFAVQAVGVALASLWLLPRGEGGDAKAGLAWLQLALTAAGVSAMGAADIAGSVVGSVALSVVGLALLALMVAVDAKAGVRLLPKGSNDPRTVVGSGYAAMFLLTASSMAFSVYGAAILQTLAGYSALFAGYVIAVEALAWTLTALMVSHLSASWPGRLIRVGGPILVLGLVLSAVGFPIPSLAWVLAAAVATGAAFGLSWSFMSQRVLGCLPDDERAIGAGGITTVRLTGSAAGAAGAAAVANLCGFAHGFSVEAARSAGVWIFVAFVPVAALGWLAAWRLGRDEAA